MEVFIQSSDLRRDKFIKKLPFRMLCTAVVLRSVMEGDWFKSVDLMDAYFHVPFAVHHRKFFKTTLQLQKPDLPVQGPTLWFFSSPSSVYEVYKGCHVTPVVTGVVDSAVSG